MNKIVIMPSENNVKVEKVDIKSETFFLTQFQPYRQDKEVGK